MITLLWTLIVALGGYLHYQDNRGSISEIYTECIMVWLFVLLIPVFIDIQIYEHFKDKNNEKTH